MRVFVILGLMGLLLRAAQSQVPQPQASARQEPAIAEGKVLNAATGEPVVHARVVIRPRMDAPNPENAPAGFSMETDDSGSYHFEKLEPGKYQIAVNKAGFLRASYGAKRVSGPGIPVTLTAGQTTSKLDVKLYPAATISGVVTDDHGEPVSGYVQLVRRMWMRGKQTLTPQGGAMPDNKGHFVITGVAPGRYFLKADPREMLGPKQPVEVDRQGNPVNAHLVPTYLGDTTNESGATSVQVIAGQQLDGADIHIRREPTFRIKGRIVSLPPGDSPLSYSMFLMANQGFGLYSGYGGRPKKDGKFEIDNVQPGSYVISVRKMGAEGTVDVPVDVSNSDVDNLQVTVPPPFDLHGKVTAEGHSDADLSGTEVMLRTNMFIGGSETVASADGSFTLHNLSATHYEVNVSTPGQPSFVKSVRLGDREVPEQSIDVTNGGGDLTIVLSYSPAKVQGMVMRTDSGSQTSIPASAISVVLIPEKRTNDYSGGLKYASTDGQGKFTFNSVPPGKYKAFAADGVDFGQWMDPDLAAAFDSRAEALDLKEGDSKQIQLTLITAEEAAQVLDRLGL
jgi:hypothetical protein